MYNTKLYQSLFKFYSKSRPDSKVKVTWLKISVSNEKVLVLDISNIQNKLATLKLLKIAPRATSQGKKISKF